MSKRKPTPPRPWQPIRFSHIARGPHYEGVPEEQLPRVYGNDRYTVTRHEIRNVEEPEGPTMTVLGIHTRTRAAVGAHDWRHFQRIKNEVAGPEREACELYPAESRLTDEANEYWLWVLPEGERFPFGFDDRRVSGPEAIGEEFKGARQRRLDND